MKRNTVIIAMALTIAFLMVLVANLGFASAIPTLYTYDLSVDYTNDMIVVTSWTDDPSVVKVTFRYWLDEQYSTPDIIHKFVTGASNGTYYIVTDSITVENGEFWVGEVHWHETSTPEGSLKKSWEFQVVPWFTSLPLVLLGSVGTIFAVKRRQSKNQPDVS